MFPEIELKKQGKISRLTNQTFKFDKRIKDGFFSANYFIKAARIVRENLPNHEVTMQFFTRRDQSMVCGLDEVIALIHTFAIRPEDLKIETLHDGDLVAAMEPVLKITGRYEDFGFLESLIDGILARRTSVATNVNEVIQAAGQTPVFSMADRQDDYLSQIGDGYATYIGGINRVSTDAQGYLWNGHGMGTMPHALIQVCGGDICKAADMYLKTYPLEKVTALIDYNNDVITDSLRLAHHLKEKLHAVRVDTSLSLTDCYFAQFDELTKKKMGPINGVSAPLIVALRKALDQEGFNHVKIICSSSFDASKIRQWNKDKIPVDMYGVGTSLINNMTCGFTGDLVILDGKPEAKVGRLDIANPRLQLVKYTI